MSNVDVMVLEVSTQFDDEGHEHTLPPADMAAWQATASHVFADQFEGAREGADGAEQQVIPADELKVASDGLSYLFSSGILPELLSDRRKTILYTRALYIDGLLSQRNQDTRTPQDKGTEHYKKIMALMLAVRRKRR